LTDDLLTRNVPFLKWKKGDSFRGRGGQGIGKRRGVKVQWRGKKEYCFVRTRGLGKIKKAESSEEVTPDSRRTDVIRKRG